MEISGRIIAINKQTIQASVEKASSNSISKLLLAHQLRTSKRGIVRPTPNKSPEIIYIEFSAIIIVATYNFD